MRRAVVLLALLAACSRPPRAIVPQVPAPPAHVTSNITRADYAGSAACKVCHAKIYAMWDASPMHHMTRLATPDDIQAPFDGAVVTSGDDQATVSTVNGERRMTVQSTRDGTHTFRITRVIGGRTREDYVGVDIDHPGDPERVLPASWIYATRSWRYKGYSVMIPERPGMRAKGPVWAQQCIGCHNTLPYLDLLFDDLYGKGAPGYQGSVSDNLLPPARTWKVRPADDDGLARALADEMTFLGAPRPDVSGLSIKGVLALATKTVRANLSGDHLVEVGIGCEVCHGGAAQHVSDPRVLPTFAITSPLVRATPPDNWTGTRAQWIDKTCMRCHTVLFSHYPYTWEGGARTDRQPGGSTINSGEARDFQLGGCASQLACTTCHDPHTKDPPEKLAAMATPAGNTLCTTCHPSLATDAALTAHSHHLVGSAGTSCIACHMPKKNMGLSYQLSRYHRIGSPDETQRVEGDRPLECAICHRDQSVEQIVSTMEQWWGKRFDREALKKLYGDDLSVNALKATLARGKPHEAAVAIGVYGEAKDDSDLAGLTLQLSADYPLVRYFAKHAIENITGEPLPVDVGKPAHEAAAEAKRWYAARLQSH